MSLIDNNSRLFNKRLKLFINAPIEYMYLCSLYTVAKIKSNSSSLKTMHSIFFSICFISSYIILFLKNALTSKAEYLVIWGKFFKIRYAISLIEPNLIFYFALLTWYACLLENGQGMFWLLFPCNTLTGVLFSAIEILKKTWSNHKSNTLYDISRLQTCI